MIVIVSIISPNLCNVQREGPVREWDLAKIGERSPGERERERERLRREREEERMRERRKSQSPSGAEGMEV